MNAPVRVDTHCPYCALNCGVSYETDGRSIGSLVRWKNSPLSQGAVCSKGVTAHEQVNHAERIRRPLIRSGSDFVEVDWDEALDRAADGFLRIMADHGRDANAVLSGGSLTNEKVYLMGKLARLAFGTPHVDYNGRFCMTSAGAANSLAFGADRMMSPLSEIERAQVVVVIGANLSDAFPVVVPKLLDGVRRRGGRVIVIDPRAARFVKPEDLHLANAPGTDAVVFSGLLRELAERGFVDEEFVHDRTVGYEEALTAAAPWHASAVEEVADVAIADLREAAELIGLADRCVYLHGRGPEQQLTGTENVLSIINVGLARGHVGRPGCGINMLTGQRNGQGGREWGQRCNQLPAGRDIADDEARQVVAERWGIDREALPGIGKTYVEILQMAGRGEIRGLLSICTNMSVSSPDLAAVEKQMAALDHLVVIDPFFSRSARHASVILPGSTFAEESGTITTIEGRVVRIDQVVAPVADRADLDIIRNLARRLGALAHFDFHLPEDVFEEMRMVSAGGPVDYSGMTYERVREEGGLFWPCPSEGHPGTPQLYTETFHHADGLARFHPISAAGPVVGTDLDYPFVLTNGRLLAQFLSGNQTMRIKAQNDRAPNTFVEIHSEVALELGLGPEDLVEVRSRTGCVAIPWKVNDRLRLDTVFMPYHWVECNRLVASDLDPVSRIPGFKYTPVQLKAVANASSIGTSLDTSGSTTLVQPADAAVSAQTGPTTAATQAPVKA